jgi:methylated-DNA-[protein]-cysteine S-methyltransferase
MTDAAARAPGFTSAVVHTPLGSLRVETTDTGVRRIRLPGSAGASVPATEGHAASAIAVQAATQLGEYARGERETFDLPVDWEGVEPLHRDVLETLRDAAPFGTTITYGALAERTGVDDPRDIGVMMSRNPLPLLVPCHRVVAVDGLGGYGGGLELKRTLLELEGVLSPRLDLGDV